MNTNFYAATCECDPKWEVLNLRVVKTGVSLSAALHFCLIMVSENIKWSFTLSYFTDAPVWVDNDIKLSLIKPFNVFKHRSVDVINLIYTSLNKNVKNLQICVLSIDCNYAGWRLD